MIAYSDVKGDTDTQHIVVLTYVHGLRSITSSGIVSEINLIERHIGNCNGNVQNNQKAGER